MQMNFDADEFFSWNYDFEGMGELCGAAELDEGRIASASLAAF